MEFLNISGRYALLSKNQEIQLGRRIQRWLTHPEPVPPQIKRSGMKAREQFVLCNMRLVTKIAKYYGRRLRGTGLTFEDILQEGILGLQRAAEKYDPECGYAMSTYATWWIRQAMSRAIEMKGGVIHVSGGAKRTLRKFRAAAEEGGTRREILERAGLRERDLFTIERATLCGTVTELDALELKDSI